MNHEVHEYILNQIVLDCNLMRFLIQNYLDLDEAFVDDLFRHLAAVQTSLDLYFEQESRL